MYLLAHLLNTAEDVFEEDMASTWIIVTFPQEASVTAFTKEGSSG